MQTNPHHLLDWLLWPILKIMWEPFSVKGSHWWHWRAYAFPADAAPLALEIKGDREAHDDAGAWQNFYQRNFGWQEVAILKAFDINGNMIKNFRIGFISNIKCEICSVIADSNVGVLIGPKNIRFFAVDENNNILKLSCHGTSRRYFFRIFQKFRKRSPKIL